MRSDLAALGVVLDPSQSGTAADEIFLGDGNANVINAGSGADVIDADAGNDTVNAGDGNDRLYGRGGTDNLLGQLGADTLLGGDGNDTLYGNNVFNWGTPGAGNGDTYDGGAGNDSLNDLETSSGDVYQLNLGGGADSVLDLGGSGDRIDVGAGVLPSQVTVRNDGTNLVVSLNANDRITVSNAYDSSGTPTSQAIEEMRFADGTVWNTAAIQAAAGQGTDASETLIAFSSADTLSGAGGNDNLQGRLGADTLLGGDGNDSLYGNNVFNWGNPGAGNGDTYDGGAGNDSLNDLETTSGDVYQLNLGGGADSVLDLGGSGDRIDVGAGVLPSQVTELKGPEGARVEHRDHRRRVVAGAVVRVDERATRDPRGAALARVLSMHGRPPLGEGESALAKPTLASTTNVGLLMAPFRVICPIRDTWDNPEWVAR